MYIYPVPGPGLGAEIAGEMTQGWPFRETWEEELKKMGKVGLVSLLLLGEKSTPCLRRANESRRGSIYNLVSLN